MCYYADDAFARFTRANFSESQVSSYGIEGIRELYLAGIKIIDIEIA